ncbi:MAG: hypothetical protein HFG73_00370 [Hungatella sp.]|nr:hypothetical protein [Hungatella sp.]
MDLMKRFYEEEEGMGTVEMVMIIAALMCIALLFRRELTEFGENIMKTVFEQKIVEAPK